MKSHDIGAIEKHGYSLVQKVAKILRVFSTRNDSQAIKVENRYFFQKCKSTPKTVVTAVLSSPYKHGSTYLSHIMLINETMNTNTGNRRL
jgi:aspartate/tyrosine/aromatic aminotransferase